MSPQRMSESKNAFDVRLLRAARGETSSRGAKERAAAAAAVLALGLDTGCGGEIAFGQRFAAFARRLLGLALGGGAVCVLATLARPAPVLAPNDDVPSRASAFVEDVAPLVVHHIGEPASTRAADDEPPVRAARTSAHAAAREPSTAEEITLLRRAKTELAAHDSACALRTLDERARRFPRGAFAEEADALRVHALAARGDAEGARAAAERFAATSPKSPSAERIRSIVTSTQR